jgi:phage tail sheath protein FI
MLYQHGIYKQEQPTSLTTPSTTSAGLQVCVGAAPINLADDPSAAVNVPVLCSTFAEAKAAVGYSDDFANYSLCEDIDASFRVFAVAPIILINVLDPSKHKKTLDATTAPVVDHQAVVEELGILPGTVAITAGGTALVKDTDYTLAFDDDGNLVVTLLTTGAGADAEEISVTADALDPTKVTEADIIGSTDPTTGKNTGLQAVLDIFPKLGVVPGLIVAPKWSTSANVDAAMNALCSALGAQFTCNSVADISSASANGAIVYTGVKAVKEAAGLSSKHEIAAWPMAKIGDKIYHYSALLAALIAATDAGNDDVPNLSPSNKPLPISATVLEDGTEVLLTLEQANVVNSYGVVTAVNFGGFRSWGNNTAAYPSSTDPIERWIGVRRFFDWWGNNLILTFFQKVDDLTNYRLIENIVDSENIVGNSYANRGYCAQAHVQFSEAENPITQILGGKIIFHMFLAPYTPAEAIEFLLEFNPSAIEAELSGGASA